MATHIDTNSVFRHWMHFRNASISFWLIQHCSSVIGDLNAFSYRFTFVIKIATPVKNKDISKTCSLFNSRGGEAPRARLRSSLEFCSPENKRLHESVYAGSLIDLHSDIHVT